MKGKGSGEGTLEFEEEEYGIENDRGNKRIKGMVIDRLGELPDSLLIHILSFLNVKKAAVTSVLSKRWEFLWAQLPRLKFSDELPWLELRGHGWEIDKVHKFVAWVNRTLAIRIVNHLEAFHLSFVYHKCFAANVDAWVQFAVENKVKTLGLHFHCWDDVYTLPQVMYSCPSLTSLQVSGCIMDPQGTIEWQSLTHLLLYEMDVEQRLLDEILSSSPALYSMTLDRCCGFDCLEVKSRSLHNLSITDSEFEDGPLLKISAPYLHRLYIMLRRELQLENVPSLVRAFIDYNYEGFLFDSSSAGVMSGAKQLLKSLQHVKELHVGFQFIKIVSMMALNGWQLPLSRREHLEIASPTECEHIICGIIGFLESSPNLETFVLEDEAVLEADEQTFNLDPAAKSDLDSNLLHLKTVKIKGYAYPNGEALLTLARILLKRAPALEEMIIRIDVEDVSDFVNFGQTLLRYPRSSTKVEIYLYSQGSNF